jgi:hypothetical protein
MSSSSISDKFDFVNSTDAPPSTSPPPPQEDFPVLEMEVAAAAAPPQETISPTYVEEDTSPTRMDEFCQCAIAAVGKIYGNCLVCGLKNYKYLEVKISAANEAIGQHFIHERGSTNDCNGYTGKFSKHPVCSRCVEMKIPLVRRFRYAPRHFRKCLEKNILQRLVQFNEYQPDPEVAAKCAMDCVHGWMEDNIKIVSRRQRISYYHGAKKTDYDDVTDWF